MGDDDLMPFGMHKGIPMKDVPDDYLLWVYTTDIGRYPSVIEYIKDNLDAIKKNVEANKLKYYKRAD